MGKEKHKKEKSKKHKKEKSRKRDRSSSASGSDSEEERARQKAEKKVGTDCDSSCSAQLGDIHCRSLHRHFMDVKPWLHQIPEKCTGQCMARQLIL